MNSNAAPAGLSPVHAVCPEHPTRSAQRTCARCGRFVCAECEGASGTCPSCLQQIALQVPASNARGTAAVGFLALSAAADTGTLLVGLAGGGTEATEGIEGLLGLLTIVGMLGAAISFLMWLHRVVRQLNALGHDIGMTPGWAVGWWFVPFANLVKPYHAVRAVAASLGGQQLVSTAMVGLWWTAWVVGNILSNIEFRLSMREGFEGSSFVRMLTIAAALFGVMGAVLCLRLVRVLQKALDERRGSVRA